MIDNGVYTLQIKEIIHSNENEVVCDLVLSVSDK